MDSLQTHKIVSSLQTTFTVKNCKPQSTVYKTVQSTDSLKTAPKADQTAQEEHRAATRAKASTAHKPKLHKFLGARVQ